MNDSTKTKTFTVMRGYWPDDEKKPKGAEVELTADEAMPLVASGVLKLGPTAKEKAAAKEKDAAE